MENPIHRHLPKDLIHEIILRLPVKSLLRFKCVSTEWNALIGSSSFANEHFIHESNPECLLITSYKPDEKKYALVLYLDDQLFQWEEPNHLQIPDSVKDIIGPVNGVFCLVNDFGEIALFNLATRQFRLLPHLVNPSYINQRPPVSFYNQKFGFGFDPSTANFKLVSIQFFWDEDDHQITYYSCLISVYNSGSDSWKHFQEIDHVNPARPIRKSLVNTYLNGFYYWLTKLINEDRDFSIYTCT